MKICRALLAALLLVSGACSVPSDASADAIVRTQAMSASTIAEFFVEPESIRLELEIGIADLQAFRNLLPDFLYEELRGDGRAIEERLPEFFANDLVIRPDGGEPLMGRVLAMGPRDRIRRDEITGEPLPPAEGVEPETVIEATIEYRLHGPPATLTLLSPSGQLSRDVGFVAYHRGVAVNDFRYLSRRQTLLLDWSDPWYTRFEHRALRRTYFAPFSGFIYVEPREVRKEIIVRPLDLQGFLDLGLEGRETIPPEIQPRLLREAAAFLRDRLPVTIDGEATPPELARVHFLERTLRTSRVVDPPRELNAFSALLGVIFVHPTTGLPERVEMEWDLFNERIRSVPGAAVDQAGPLPTLLEPDSPTLEWRNFLKDPKLPTLVEVRRPPTVLERTFVASRWLVLMVGVGAVFVLVQRMRGGQVRGGIAALWATPILAVIIAAFAIGSAVRVSNERAGEVVEGLLHNVYRAFDDREEERVYDVLAGSIEGDLLEAIYLETRRGLELTNQGGARARVDRIELVDIESREGDDGAFLALARWNVFGSVGHWGHVHARSNAYEAELEVSPVDGAWKLTDLEILDEERL